MLIIYRKPGESVKLGEAITITVLAVEGWRVKLGCHAPPDVEIVREELLDEPRPLFVKGLPPKADDPT